MSSLLIRNVSLHRSAGSAREESAALSRPKNSVILSRTNQESPQTSRLLHSASHTFHVKKHVVTAQEQEHVRIGGCHMDGLPVESERYNVRMLH